KIEVFGLLTDVKAVPARYRDEAATVYSRIFDGGRPPRALARFCAIGSFGKLMVGTAPFGLPGVRPGVLTFTFRIARTGAIQLHVRVRANDGTEVAACEEELTLVERQAACVVIPARRLFEKSADPDRDLVLLLAPTFPRP